MALGIMSFALVGLVGLLPAGLSQFRGAIDMTVKAQITQELTSMVQRTSFGDLATLGTPGSPEVLYYDGDGARLPANAASAETYAYKAETYVGAASDLGRLLVPTWDTGQNGMPLNTVSAVHIEITSRTAPNRPHTSITYVANTGS